MKLNKKQKAQVANYIIDHDPTKYVPQQELVVALGLLSQSDVARALEATPVQIFYAIERNHIPSPPIRLGMRKYYWPHQLEKLKEKFKGRTYRTVIFTPSEVKAIREYHTANPTATRVELSKQFDVSINTIINVLKGKKYYSRPEFN